MARIGSTGDVRILRTRGLGVAARGAAANSSGASEARERAVRQTRQRFLGTPLQTGAVQIQDQKFRVCERDGGVGKSFGSAARGRETERQTIRRRGSRSPLRKDRARARARSRIHSRVSRQRYQRSVVRCV